MKLEMICTGEEVLSGQIVDTNAAWFANTMMDEGIEVQRRVTVGDRLADLIQVFQERSHHADVIVVNGGLGPTTDDLSAEAMAAAIGEPLLENAHWREQVQAFYQQRGRDMPASNVKQAMLPASAVMVDNPVGTACGFRIKLNRAWLFFTPGVPFEFKQMIKEQFLPFIRQEFANELELQPTKILKLLTLGIGESSLQELIETLTFPEGITLGYRASIPYVEIKVFARGELAIAALPLIQQSLQLKLGSLIVTTGEPSLSLWLHQHLVQQPQTIALAESCTGGLLTSQLVAFAGSSAYLTQGLVTYSNEAKVKVLGVKPHTLDTYGAVSIATAEEMAQGARALLDVDFALSTTGIAGPDGGSDHKPVGTVAIALATRDAVVSQMLIFPNHSRLTVQQFSCAVAYDMLRRALLKQPVIVDYPNIQRLD